MRGGKEDLLLQDTGPSGAALHRWHQLPIFGGMQTGGSYFFLSFSAVCPGRSWFPREGLGPGPQQGNRALLTTAPPGNFQEALISNIYFNRKNLGIQFLLNKNL